MTRIGDRIRVPRTAAPVGIARRDVTPPVGIRAKNWGPADWERSEGTHQPLTLTAVVIGGDDPHVLVAVDATWWRRVDDEARVRGAVLSALGIPPERLMIALSHTHAGPVLCSADAHLAGGELIPGYLDALATAAADTAREALAGRSDGVIEWTTGHCSLASDRELDLDGRALVGFNPERDADDTVVVGRIAVAGEPIGVIVNYACHPTTLAWGNRLVSPDYVGGMRAVVEAGTGVPCVFLQGASGELAPRVQYTGDTAVAERHGSGLGHAVLSALAALPEPSTEIALTSVVESGAPLAMWEQHGIRAEADAILSSTGTVALDLVALPTIEELEREWEGIDPRSRSERVGRARNLRDGYIDGPRVEHPLWAWALGDVIVVGHPGEAYSRFQQTLRAAFPDRVVVVMNLVNGPGFVYLPTDEAYERGAYQAWQTPLAPGSLARLERHAIASVEALVARAGRRP